MYICPTLSGHLERVINAFFTYCSVHHLSTLDLANLLTFPFITVPTKAPKHQHAIFVFANFGNNTGWSKNDIGQSFHLHHFAESLRLLDVHRSIHRRPYQNQVRLRLPRRTIHLSEEIHRLEKMIPVAVL